METVHTLEAPAEDHFKSADSIVRRHVPWAMGLGLIPVPLVDIAAVSAVQVDMLKDLCKVYDVPFSENAVKSWISALALNTATSLGIGVVKMVPLFGSIGGGLLMSGVAGASTFAIGQVAIRHFENGGNLKDMKPEEYKTYFREKMDEGKAYIKKQKTQFRGKDPLARLKDLEDLREAGTITDEEFENLKAKIMADV